MLDHFQLKNEEHLMSMSRNVPYKCDKRYTALRHDYVVPVDGHSTICSRKYCRNYSLFLTKSLQSYCFDAHAKKIPGYKPNIYLSGKCYLLNFNKYVEMNTKINHPDAMLKRCLIFVANSKMTR